MRHIRQKLENDCGLAALAMAARVGYYAAAEFIPSDRIDGILFRGMSVPAMLDALEAAGLGLWRVHRPKPYRALSTFAVKLEASNVALMIIRRPADSFGHWVAWGGHLVHDPELSRGCCLDGYARRSWHVIRLIHQA